VASPHNAPGIVQIAQGLGEHIGRYAELAETLAQAEFIVCGNDHGGHGLTAKPKENFGSSAQAALINSSKTWFSASYGEEGTLSAQTFHFFFTALHLKSRNEYLLGEKPTRRNRQGIRVTIWLVQRAFRWR